MRIRQLHVWATIVAALLVWAAVGVRAHNPCCKMASIGVPAAAITLNGTAAVGEWAGAGPATAVGGISPLNGTITALHKADGLYLLFVITDTTNNNNDTLNMRFDILHNASATPDADDFGVSVRRSGQANAGPAQNDPATWAPVAGGTVGVTSAATTWTVEFRLPVGPPSNLQVTPTGIGVYFNFYDADNGFGANSAKFSQWPPAPMGNLNQMLDGTPSQWGDLIFDPQTTFTDVSVPDVHRSDAGAANYYKLNYGGVNSFEAELKNPGGTTVPDASGVRINLYLAARGIGESWHRLDTNAVLATDCAAATFPSSVLTKGDVCSGNNPLPDISTTTINDVVANTAKYTIQNGLKMDRTGGNTITVPAASDTAYPVIDWNTTPAQDAFFKKVTVNGMTYDRAHDCMLAEALVPNDPNPGNNTQQVNMDFFGIPGSMLKMLTFSLGWPGFGKYDPNAGNRMFLQVVRRNADDRFRFELNGVNRLPQGNGYVGELRGQRSLPVEARITAPPADVIGRTLKENLMIPPGAGGRVRTAAAGLPPVYVQVPADSVIWIVNYSLDDQDEQYVDVDGKGRLPHNGPGGIPESLVRDRAGARGRLVPRARLGELVLSFDGFKTGIPIAEGVQVRVPRTATYAALAINDYVGGYGDNAGTGFRVKVLVRPADAAPADLRPALVARRASLAAPAAGAQVAAEIARLNVIPILDVIPEFCVNGYEDIHEKRDVNGQATELFRYIGNVCWGVLTVMNGERPRADKGDQPR
jgi:hypothetical protein